MAIPEAVGDGSTLSLAEVARLLGVSPSELLRVLIRDRFLYRYTGIGRPIAYVRWVRVGLFVNTEYEVRITLRGMDRVIGA